MISGLSDSSCVGFRSLRSMLCYMFQALLKDFNFENFTNPLEKYFTLCIMANLDYMHFLWCVNYVCHVRKIIMCLLWCITCVN